MRNGDSLVEGFETRKRNLLENAGTSTPSGERRTQTACEAKSFTFVASRSEVEIQNEKSRRERRDSKNDLILVT